MTQTAQTVLEHYQVRKSKRQKQAFRSYVGTVAAKQGYPCLTEAGRLGARNLVVGDPDRASVVYTAHYDTCPRLPFPNFITPKNVLIYLLYQILLITVLCLLPMAVLEIGSEHAVQALSWENAWQEMILSCLTPAWYIFVLWLLMAGPANRHTANDNTSGVTALLNLMEQMPIEYRDRVAFVFFDLEESGLFGSKGFAARHKKSLENTPLINFDCVSDGDNILFAVRKGAARWVDLLQQSFPETEEYKVHILTRGVFYPSDQANFQTGVGVAALKRTKRGGLLYMNRIHTKRDTVYCEENISFLVRGAIRFTENLQQIQRSENNA